MSQTAQKTSTLSPEVTQLDPSSTSEHGRTYHSFKHGKYVLPNDSKEQYRLNSQHQLLKLLLDGSLGSAPVGRAPSVLDIGTGTGIWAMDFASVFPDSQVVGMDLSLIQPSNTPPNCRFVRGDAEDDDWPVAGTFDYIHLRMMVSCFDQPRRTIKSIFEKLAPGGWVEFQDVEMGACSEDGSTRGTSMERLGGYLESGLVAINRDPKIARQYESILRETGFVDVVARQIQIPCGIWSEDPKQQALGKLFLSTYTEESLTGLSTKLLLAAGLTIEQGTQLIAGTVRDYLDPEIHGYIVFHVVHGRKPE
ncbi:hypothetical protein MY4038_010047 [Beauveria bassiana]